MKRLLASLLLIATSAFGADGKILSGELMAISTLRSYNKTITGNLTAGSPCIASPSSTTNIYANLRVYDSTAPKLLTDTYVVGLPGACSSGQIEMSSVALSSATGDTLLFGGAISQLVNQIPYDYGNLITYFSNLKSNLFTPSIPNQIADAFLTSIGTLSNATIGGSQLAISTGNTSGSYEINQPVTENVSKTQGVANMALQALAPKNTTITSNTIVFSGDVTPWVAVNKNVVLMKQVTSGLGLQHIYLLNSFGNVAQLSVTSASYSSGSDETTVVLKNPQSLDLSMGLSSGSYNSTLRMVPFDYQFQAKTASSQAYNNLTLKGAATTGTLKIPGQDNAVTQCGYTASVFNFAAGVSPNRTYAVIVAEEGISTNPKSFSFCYTKDGGATWTKHATTKSNNDSGAVSVLPFELFSENYHKLHDGMIVCANNGKCFMAYPWHSPSPGSVSVRAVYTDLSAGSPTITDSANPSGGANVGNCVQAADQIAGVVFSTSNDSNSGRIGADLSDLSFIAVPGVFDNNSIIPTFFSNGGATYLGCGSAGFTVNAQYPSDFEITGTAGSHRAIMLYGGTSATLSFRYYDEGGSTGTSLGTGTICTGSCSAAILGATSSSRTLQSGSRVHILYRDISNEKVRYATGVMNSNGGSAPTFSDFKISNNTADLYTGGSTSDARLAYHRVLNSRVVTSPTDDKHVLMALDEKQPNDHNEATLYEIADSTNFVGFQINNTTQSSTINLNDASTRQQLGQTFTPTNTALAAVGLQCRTASGGDLHGKTMTLQVQTTSSNHPTGTVLGTSSTIDLQQVGTGSADLQRIYATFNPKLTLSTSTRYALVLVPSYSTDATNFLQCNISTGALQTGETIEQYNGTTWSTNSTNGFTSEFFTEWKNYIGYGRELYYNTNVAANGAANPARVDDQLTSIFLNPSGGFQVLFNYAPIISDAFRPFQGQPHRRAGTFGSSTTQSTLTSSVVEGYSSSNYDRAVQFDVSLGVSAFGQKNVATGAVDSTKLGEDRSGWDFQNVSYNNVTFGADANFFSGQAGTFNGTSSYIQYQNSAAEAVTFRINPQNKFAFMAEISPTSVGGGNTRCFFTENNPTGNAMYSFCLNSSGFLRFFTSTTTGSSSASTTASDTAETTSCHWVMATDDGTTTKLWRTVNCTNNTTFTEVASYSTQQRPVWTNGTPSIVIGADFSASAATSFFAGKIGCVKAAIGASSFNYAHCKDQSAFPNMHNLGTMAVAWNKAGTNATTLGTGTNFNTLKTLAATPNQAAVVDSYEDQFMWREFLPTAGNDLWFKILMGRSSTSDASFIDGYVNRHSSP